MGYGTQNHEKIIANLIRFIGNLLDDENFNVYGSNLALHIPGFVRRLYNSDCVVVKGEPDEVVLRGNMKAVANPAIVVEVLSGSTRNFDLGTKQRNYRKIPHLQQIIFIESTEILVTSHTRLEGTNEWRLLDFTEMSDEIPILGQGHVKLKDLYHKVKF